jgi:disulfide bond formation protein DsbB
MIWRGMTRGLKRSALLALALPALVALTTISTLADTSPSPSGTTALPGDPQAGGTLYAQNCATCHGANLGGGIGPALNPIVKLPGTTGSPLDFNFLIDIITNGRKHQSNDPVQTDMPAKGGNPSLTDQNIKDLAAFIIQQNQAGNVTLSPGDLAKSTILWVFIGVGAMAVITYLLAQYNMRWIARRAAARNK